jgi:hypothetical protein
MAEVMVKADAKEGNINVSINPAREITLAKRLDNCSVKLTL